MACIRCERVIPDEVASRPAHEGGQAYREFQRLEQELVDAVTKGAFELVHHKAVAVARLS